MRIIGKRPIKDTDHTVPLSQLVAIPEKDLERCLGIEGVVYAYKSYGPNKYRPQFTDCEIWRHNVCLCKYERDSEDNCFIIQLNRVRLSIVPRYDAGHMGDKMLAISTMETYHRGEMAEYTGLERAKWIRRFNVGLAKFRETAQESIVAATIYDTFKDETTFNPLIWRTAKSFAKLWPLTGCHALKRLISKQEPK